MGFRSGIVNTKHITHQQPDCARNPIAITQELGLITDHNRLQVRFNASDQLQNHVRWHLTLAGQRNEVLNYRRGTVTEFQITLQKVELNLRRLSV